ncbi:nickel/cobalt transporter [Mesorhizobium sp. SP-1A]|uniref:nickel/cobalt transporter n=1 Tax=Mesorhizobium sp. SP-1A TaxID=3077840 RepID=UPI0039655F7E
MAPRALPAFAVASLAAVALTSLAAGHAHAQSSLGIGTNDAMPSGTGLFAHQLMWINLKQQEFYRALAGAMKAMREDGSKLWLLIGLSFLYGIFHAAGPGHGKAVISSYMVANEVALRRGILLSFVSAFLQAVTAIGVMLLAFFALRGTTVSMTDAAWFLEISSYVLVTLFGAWLLWKKAGPPLLRLFGAAPAYSLSAARTGGTAVPAAVGQNAEGLEHRYERARPLRAKDHACGSDAGRPLRFRATDEVCATCGHAHAPDPALISGDRFDWRTAWSAVVAVGIRPCSGALIVLSFAFLNGLWAGGILSVLAMSVGTAITVSLLATLAVTAKDWAVTIAGDGRLGNRVHAIVEIGGAALVFLFGLLLLSASLSG